MLKTTTFLASFAIACILCLPSHAASSAGNALPSDAAIDAELRTRELALLTAPIKSKSDLNDFLAKTHRKHNPLSLLSRTSQQDFINSLTFGEHGLSSFNYAIIESELPYTAAYRVLALFGMQHLAATLTRAKVETELDAQIKSSAVHSTLMADYREYRCVTHGTCGRAADMICTSNC